jgi:hypothetical protein
LQITTTQFDGLDAVDIQTAKAHMIIVTEVGPRIAYFAAKRGKQEGRNLLFWDYERKYQRKDWFLLGGHRVWHTRPGADEGEETYVADNAPCHVRILKRSVQVTASAIPGMMVQKSLTVTVEDDSTFTVDNRLTTIGDMIWSGGLWALTCTLPGKRTTYGIPLGDGGAWDVFTVVIPKAWGGHAIKVNDPQISFTEDSLVLKARGNKAKRMVQAPQGIMGMTDLDEKLSFLVKTPYVRGAQYPLNCNTAFFVGPKNFMVEMEHMAPETTLKPGESIRNTQTWALREPIDWTKLKGLLKI